MKKPTHVFTDAPTPLIGGTPEPKQLTPEEAKALVEKLVAEKLAKPTGGDAA